MKATQVSKTTAHTFKIQHDGREFVAIIHINESGHFIDEVVQEGGNELDIEGEDGDLREKIIDFIDDNWETLTKE